MNWEIPAKSKDTGDVVRAGTCRLDSLILKTGPRPRHPRSNPLELRGHGDNAFYVPP
jgi:hypothetical protein